MECFFLYQMFGASFTFYKNKRYPRTKEISFFAEEFCEDFTHGAMMKHIPGFVYLDPLAFSKVGFWPVLKHLGYLHGEKINTGSTN